MQILVDNLRHSALLPVKDFFPAVAGTVLDAIPCAAAVWSRDRGLSTLNHAAREMFGFGEQELERDPSLWIERIHPEDRDLFRAAWKKLLAGERKISCDYRFSVNAGEKDVWIRDVSVSQQNASGAVEGVTSVYVDVSDLRAHGRKSRERKQLAGIGEIIGSIVHGIKNDLQIITWGLDDVMRLTGGKSSECQPLFEGIERISRSIQELREFFSSAEPRLSRASPKTILQELVGEKETSLSRQKIHLRVRCPGAMPLVRLDWNEFRRVLGHVIEFSRLLLPKGGDLEIKIGMQEPEGKRHIELQICCVSATSLAVEEDDVFRPFLKVNGCQAGLGIALARQILGRHNGDISFHKQNPKRGLFTISLQAH